MRYTLENLEAFPKLTQERPLGCIPTSIAAIMTYYGEENWNEAEICDEVDRKKELGESFCFEVFKKYYLDEHLGKDFLSGTRGFGEDLLAWRDFVVEKIRVSVPVVVSFSYLNDGPHVMTVVEGDSETTSLRLHDPARGDFRCLDVREAPLERENLRRNSDVLWIESQDPGTSVRLGMTRASEQQHRSDG